MAPSSGLLPELYGTQVMRYPISGQGIAISWLSSRSLESKNCETCKSDSTEHVAISKQAGGKVVPHVAHIFQAFMTNVGHPSPLDEWILLGITTCIFFHRHPEHIQDAAILTTWDQPCFQC